MRISAAAQQHGLQGGMKHSYMCCPAVRPCVAQTAWPRSMSAASVPILRGTRSSRSPAIVPQATARASAAFGVKLSALPATRSRAAAPCIHGAVMRRGNRIIITAVLAGVQGGTDVRSLLEADVRSEANLVQGQLENGLRYIILPNKLPPHRFEAHLEIHAGSVDELPTEQGIAHLVEHVTFLGSKRREALLGTGARANAYTDFHHTVFHVHAPIVNQTSKAPMLPQVLEALEEIAFHPEFLAARIEKERLAVTAEAQMMNTIEYRVDCQLLQYLHYENNLGFRFPIGKMEQVAKWPHTQLRDFWSKWYYPANATLLVVGDLDRDMESMHALIQRTFGHIPAAVTTPEDVEKLQRLSAAAKDGHQPPAYVVLPADSLPATDLKQATMPGKGFGKSAKPAAANGVQPTQLQAQPANVLLKQRHPVRPPVNHVFGYGPLPADFAPAPVSMFRHPLLQHFTLSLFCKLPVAGMSKMTDLRRMLIVRILLSVFQFRVNKRYVQAEPPFIAIDLDISDSGREGCAVSTVIVTCEPHDWEGAVGVAVQEMRRLQRHGVTEGELERYTSAILRDSAQLAKQGNKIPSLDTLNFLMESVACGNTVMGHQDAHAAMLAVAETVGLEEVNSMARAMLTFVSDYGREAEALAEAAAHPDTYAYLGATRATSIVATVPAYISSSGSSIAGSIAPPPRAGASLGAAGHIDVDQVDLAELEEASKLIDDVEIPEGAIKFDPSPRDIARVLSDTSYSVEPVKHVPCPQHLLPPAELDAKIAALKPSWKGLDGQDLPGGVLPAADEFSGVTQRRLSNGMRINYRTTDNESNGMLIRLIAPGGRASEKLETGPDGFGAVVVGVRTISEAGTVGDWPRDQTEVFCITNLINCALESDEENIVMDFHCAADDASMAATFELIHMFVEHPVWDEEAMRRAKTAFASSCRSVAKSLEKETAERVMVNMMGGPEQRQLRDPTEEELDALTLEGMQRTVTGLMHAGALEVNVVGDFDAVKLEALLLRFLGTVEPRPADKIVPIQHVSLHTCDPPFEGRHQSWHLPDSDERAVAYIAGPAPPRWGPLGSAEPLQPWVGPVEPPPVPMVAYPNPALRQQDLEARRKHPLYTSCVLMLLVEIINSRLFTTVRDSLGLTYDVSFEVSLLDRVRAGWFSVHVTSQPDKIHDALDASVRVLRDIETSPINRRELQRARTTLVSRHESELKDNTYWLGLLTHLQNPHVPWKNVQCLRDIKAMYESVTVEDLYNAYSQLQLHDDKLFTHIGTSGKSAPFAPDERLVGGIGSSKPSDASDWAAQGDGATPGALPSPMALFTAMVAAAQSLTLKKAMQQVQVPGKKSTAE